MMNARRVAATAALLTLPFGLVACGSSKPSKDDVESGMQSIVMDQMGESDSAGDVQKKVAKEMTSCIVDKVYEEVDTDTLNAMKDGEEGADISAEDEDTLNEAMQECTKTAMP